jgi:hypothetical protein
MIKKINENAYFVIDLTSFCGSINNYDNVLANQTIMSSRDFDQDFKSPICEEDLIQPNDERASMVPLFQVSKTAVKNPI